MVWPVDFQKMIQIVTVGQWQYLVKCLAGKILIIIDWTYWEVSVIWIEWCVQILVLNCHNAWLTDYEWPIRSPSDFGNGHCTCSVQVVVSVHESYIILYERDCLIDHNTCIYCALPLRHIIDTPINILLDLDKYSCEFESQWPLKHVLSFLLL